MTSAPARFSGLHRGPTCMLVKRDSFGPIVAMGVTPVSYDVYSHAYDTRLFSKACT